MECPGRSWLVRAKWLLSLQGTELLGGGLHTGLLSRSSQKLLTALEPGCQGAPCMGGLTGPAPPQSCPSLCARGQASRFCGKPPTPPGCPQPGSVPSGQPSHQAGWASSCSLTQGGETTLGSASAQRRGWSLSVTSLWSPLQSVAIKPWQSPRREVFFPRA